MTAKKQNSVTYHKLFICVETMCHSRYFKLWRKDTNIALLIHTFA